MAGYADDLALAHLLADTADAISMARFRALDLRVESKPDLTPVSDADTAVERAIRALLAAHRPGDGLLGEEYGAQPAGRPGRPALGDRPDRRHQELRPRRAGLGHPDRAAGGRPAGGRAGLRAGAGPALVGGAGRGRVRRAGTGRRRAGSASPAVRRLADASFCYSSLTGWESAGRLDAMLELMRDALAQPGVRRLLRLHAAGRGRAGRDGRAGAVAVGRGRAGADRHRGRRHVHRPDRSAGPDRRAGTESSAVATNGLLHADILARLGRPAER